MTEIRIFDCDRRCHTISIIKLVRAATGKGLAESKAVVDELYSRSGSVIVAIPDDVDVEKLAREIRACKTQVEILPHE